MEKKRAMLYPFQKDCFTLIRHWPFDKIYLTECVSPKGFGFCGKDVGFLANGMDSGVIVQDDFEIGLAGCDVVIFYESEIPFQIYKKQIKKAVESNKEIVFLCDFQRSEWEELKEDLEQAVWKQYTNHYAYQMEQGNMADLPLAGFESSVVFVAGICEDTGKYEVQLSMVDALKEKGYQVAFVGSRTYSEVYGGYAIPDFLSARNLSETEKIILLNQFLKKIEETKHPDVMVIGVPGGIIPVNKRIHGDFGTMAFEISRAIIPDAAVLCSPLTTIHPNTLQEFLKVMKYRFSADVSCIYVNATKPDINGEELTMYTVKKEKVRNVIHEIKEKDARIPITCEESEVVEKVLQTLTAYGENNC